VDVSLKAAVVRTSSWCLKTREMCFLPIPAVGKRSHGVSWAMLPLQALGKNTSSSLFLLPLLFMLKLKKNRVKNLKEHITH